MTPNTLAAARTERRKSFQREGTGKMSDAILAKGFDSTSPAPRSWGATFASTTADEWLRHHVEWSVGRGVFTVTVNLTPELAKAILANNPGNRILSERKSSEYARDILAKRWAHNGETIIIAKNGELNDGQHRCQAVVKAGIGIVTQITFGVERATRDTVDVGVKRTVGAHLGMSGYPHYVALALAIATVITFKKAGKIGVSSDMRPTSSEILEWAGKHPEMQESVKFGLKVCRQVRASAGLFGGLHYLFAEKSRDDADKFFEALAVGENLTKGDPIFELRSLLIRNRISKAKLPDSEVAGRAIKAWNSYRANRQVGLLRISVTEDYPSPR